MPYEENNIQELCEKCGKECKPEELNKELCKDCDMEYNTIQERFKYELKDWIDKLGSMPVKVIKTGDHSASYEIETMHVFKLENGKFATVIESGCSCYDPSLATIEVLPDKQTALDQFTKWDKENG